MIEDIRVAAPAMSRAEATGGGLSRMLTLSALVVFTAVAPLLPPIAWKVKAMVLAMAALGAGMYARARTEGSLGRSAVDLPAVTFLAVAVLATVFSVDRVMSFLPSRLRGEGLVIYIVYAAMALTTARLSRQEIGALVTAVLISGGLIGAVAVGQYYGLDLLPRLGFTPTWLTGVVGPSDPQLQFSPATDTGRGHGTLGNSGLLGGYAALLLPIGIALTVQGRTQARAVYAACTILLYGALVSSQSRAAWVGSALGMLLLVALMPRRREVYGRLLALTAAFVVITVAMALTRPALLLSRRAASSFDVQTAGLQARLYLWKHTLPLIGERPLLGWGFSTLLGRFPDYGSPDYVRVFGDDVITLIDTPHNELLHVAYSTGLAGLAAYLWLWAVLALLLSRAIRARSPAPPLLGALLASLGAYFVWLQFGWSHIGPANVFWTMAGVAAALGRQAVTTGSALGATIPAPSRAPEGLVSTPQTNT